MKPTIIIVLFIVLAAGLGYGVYSGVIPGKEAVTALVSGEKDAAADAQDTVQSSAQSTAWDIVRQTPSLSSFADALERYDLRSELEGDGPITVFAPSNTAFEKLPEALNGKSGDPQFDGLFQIVLKPHIIPGAILEQQLPETPLNIAALGGQPVELKKLPEGGIAFNGLPSTQTNVLVKNGVIHILDDIHLPGGLATGFEFAPPPPAPQPAPEAEVSSDAPAVPADGSSETEPAETPEASETPVESPAGTGESDAAEDPTTAE